MLSYWSCCCGTCTPRRLQAPSSFGILLQSHHVQCHLRPVDAVSWVRHLQLTQGADAGWACVHQVAGMGRGP